MATEFANGAALSHLPQFKVLPEPVFTRNNSPWLLSGNEVLYWPCLFPAYKYLSNPINNFYLYYSTDHSTGQGGIGLATAPHPRGPWTDYGTRIYTDTVVGSQTETPHAEWDAVNSRVMLYYQNKNAGVNQSTVLATSPNGVTNWTRQGVVIDVDTPQRVPGDGHTGYARVYRRGKKWIAHHLLGGTDRAHFGVSYSDDGLTWGMDKRAISNRVELTNDNAVRISGFQTWPFFWSGRQFCAYVESPLESSVNSAAKYIKLGLFDGPTKITPLSDLISPGAYSWCDITTHMPHVLEWQGTLYLIFLAQGTTQQKGCFGLMECSA